MRIPAGNGYVVEVDQAPGLGSAWTVRVFRKSFLRKHLVSSDWFLNAEQARQFAREAAGELESKGAAGFLEERKPGWTLHRP